MALNVQRVAVWAGDLEDRSGSLADKLGALAGGGANLEFVIARRKPEQPGGGVLFVAPVKGKKVQDAARNAGMSEAADVPTLRVEAPDRPGLGERIMRAIGDEGINARGFSAAAMGNRCVAYIGFDGSDDADRAAAALKRLDAARPTRGKKKPAAGGARRTTKSRAGK
jgi:hypothetical protein